MVGLLASTSIMPKNISNPINNPDTLPQLSSPDHATLPQHSESISGASSENPLEKWKLLPRFPIGKSNAPTIQKLLEAARSGERITFLYEGGSTPGTIRIATVECVFRHEDSPHIYISTYCHLRGSHRMFRADRLRMIDTANQ